VKIEVGPRSEQGARAKLLELATTTDTTVSDKRRRSDWIPPVMKQI
jgi:hypothetical protein